MSAGLDEEIQVLEKQIKRAKLQKELAVVEAEMPVAEIPVAEIPVAEQSGAEEEYMLQCLGEDVSKHFKLPKAERMYKTAAEFEKSWLPLWESDERLKVFRQKEEMLFDIPSIHIIKQDVSNENRVITEEHQQMVDVAREGIRKPTKGNRPKTQKKKAVEEKAVEEKAVEEKAGYPKRPFAAVVRTVLYRDWGVLLQQYIKADHDDQKIIYNLGKAYKQYQKSGMAVCKPPNLAQCLYIAYVNQWVSKSGTPTRYALRKEHEKLLEGTGPSILSLTKNDPALYSTIISKASVRASKWSWLTTDELLEYLQENDMNCLKMSWPVKQLSKILATHYKIEWTKSWSETVRRRLERLEKEGLVVREKLERSRRIPNLPTEKEMEENKDIIPTCMQFYSISAETSFWYLTEKGLKA